MNNKISLAMIVCSLMLFSIFTVASAQAIEYQWSGDSGSSACYDSGPNPEPPSEDNDADDGGVKSDEVKNEQPSDDDTKTEPSSDENSDTISGSGGDVTTGTTEKDDDHGESYIIGYFVEPWTNIATRENIYVHNPKANEFKQITLKKEEHYINQISFTSETNRKNLRFMIEALNDRSIYVDESASEHVCSYFNLWINTNEDNADKCHIKEFEIQFSVPQEWINDNSISKVTLMYYDEGWVELSTTEVDEYEYTSRIDNFGRFAIIGE